jgi:hypothetical protein
MEINEKITVVEYKAYSRIQDQIFRNLSDNKIKKLLDEVCPSNEIISIADFTCTNVRNQFLQPIN